MTEKQIRAVYHEYSALLKEYEERGYLFSGSLRKEVFYIQKLVPVKKGECIVHRVKLYSFDAAKQIQRNVDDMEKMIQSYTAAAAHHAKMRSLEN